MASVIIPGIKDELGISLSRRDLSFFSEYCWEEHPAFRKNAPMHNQWFDILQYKGADGAMFKQTLRLHIEAPREHAKTTCLGVKYPLWRLGHNPNLRILVVSKTSTLATGVIRESKGNIERNRRLQEVFPDLKPGTPWSDQEIQVKRTVSYIDKTSSMRGVGLHGSITGGRADLVVVDDPFDLAEVQTQTQRLKVENWIEQVVIPVLAPRGELIAIGTRWHYADYWGNLINKAIEKGGMYVVKVYRPTKDQSDPTSPLESLWKGVWSEERLLERKAEIGTIRFNCLYLNDPSGLEGLVFKEEWLHYYNPEKLKFIEDMVLFMGVDPAISEDPKSDWTAIIVLGLNPYRMQLHILDIYRGHLDFPDQVKKIKEIYDRWDWMAKKVYGWEAGVQTIGIESVAYQKALFSASFMQGLPVKEVKQHTNKNVRLVGLSPHFEGGRILLPDPEIERPGWFEPFVLEYVSFPRGRNDDQLDALDCGVAATDLTGGGYAFVFGGP